MERVNLSTLNNGAVVDLFNAELEKVLANIEDENTLPTTTRSITIKLDIKPSKTRRDAETKITVSSKLAPAKPTESLIYLDVEDGELTAFEDNPKQEFLDFSNETAKVGGM